jgi:hypothetical protein
MNPLNPWLPSLFPTNCGPTIQTKPLDLKQRTEAHRARMLQVAGASWALPANHTVITNQVRNESDAEEDDA